MIEIILRDDINEYEPKAFFGFTKRTILFAVLSVGLAAATFFLLTSFGLAIVLVGYFIIVEGLIMGIIGLGKFSGLPLEKYLAIAMGEFFIPKELSIKTVHVVGANEKRLKEVRRERTKEDKQKNRIEHE